MSDIKQSTKQANKSNIYLLAAGNPLIIDEIESLWKEYCNDMMNSKEFGELICRYGSTPGYEPFLEAFKQYCNKYYGWTIDESNILVTPGSQIAYFYAVNAFSGKSNGKLKKLLCPILPEYTGYQKLPFLPQTILGLKSRISFLKENYYQYRLNPEFKNIINENIGMILLSRPNNPTGNILPETEVKEIIKIASENGIIVTMDGAYLAPIPNLQFDKAKPIYRDNVLNIFSFSKAGLPGSRIGVIVGNSELINKLENVQSNICLHSSRFGQGLALHGLRSGRLKEICEKIVNPLYRRKRKMAEKIILENLNSNIPVNIHVGKGTFFLWLWFENLPISDLQLYEILKNHNVFIVPGSYFFLGLNTPWKHTKECIRISLAVPDKDLEIGLKKIIDKIENIYKDKGTKNSF